MKQDLFDFADYKDFIRFKIQSPENTRGYSASLARAAGIHGSFLSKVLSTHVHLTPDQAADFCVFWGLAQDETAYFIGLLNLARASSKNLQALVRNDLKNIRRRREELSYRFNRSEVVDEGFASRYYATWYVICVHMLMQIPEFRTAQQISKRLSLPMEVVQSVLASLAEMGFAAEQGGQWKPKKADLHLNRDSVWANVHYISWMTRTIMKLQEGAAQEVSYSSVLTVSKKTAESIKRLLINDLEEIRTRIVNSGSEELYYLGLNFYRV